MHGDSFEHYVELVQERVNRPELWRRFPKSWETGGGGGPRWATSPEHVRPNEPRYYARRCRLFSFAAWARFHFAVGDDRLRRISIVFDPISSVGGGAADLVATLVNFVGHSAADQLGGEPDRPGCRVSGEMGHCDDGLRVVIDIAAIIPPPDEPPSMEKYFVYYD